MSNKNIFHNFLLVLIFFIHLAEYVSSKIVYGQIMDEQTHLPLDGASIILENSNIGTISNQCRCV